MEATLYAISIFAASITQDLMNESKTDVEFSHIAFIVAADNRRSALVEAKNRALKMWPKEDGWSRHAANIYPVPLSYIDFITSAFSRSVFVEDPIKDPQLVKFDDWPADG